MSHIDDGKLNALLDGELDESEAAAVREHIAGCGECAGRLEEARTFLAQATDLLGALDLPAVQRPAAATTAGPPPPARRVTVTAKEAALDLDDATHQSPAIRVEADGRREHGRAGAAPEPLLRRPAPMPPRRERRFDYSTLAWAATIILAIGVGYLGNEVQHASRERAAAGSDEGSRGLMASRSPGQIGGDTAAAKTPPTSLGRPSAPAAAATAARTGAAPVRRGEGGPPAAKAPPGEGTPRVPGRAATGLGHKLLDQTQENLAGGRAANARDQLAAAKGNRNGAVAVAGVGGVPPVSSAVQPAAPPEAQAPPPLPVIRRARPAAEGSAESVLAVEPSPSPLDARGVTAAGGAAANGFRTVTLEEAVSRLRGAIRLVDGVPIERVMVGPGSLVAGADSGRDVVRVTIVADGAPVVLDQQRLDPPTASAPGDSAATPSFAGLAVGDTLFTVAPDGQRRARWLDGLGFWLSLSGRLPADSLRQLIERVR